MLHSSGLDVKANGDGPTGHGSKMSAARVRSRTPTSNRQLVPFFAPVQGHRRVSSLVTLGPLWALTSLPD